jgi:hypothetical protein
MSSESQNIQYNLSPKFYREGVGKVDILEVQAVEKFYIPL